jgi:hypothetical protein
MLYTLAGASKATGLRELTILKAIEDRHITGTKDLFGEWHVEHTELHRLYPPIAEGNASKDAAQPYAAADATALEAEIGALIREAGDSLQQQRENGACRPSAEGHETQASRQLITTEPSHAWDHAIRIHDRDKILVSASPSGTPRARIAIITGAIIVSLSVGWVGGLSSNHLLGHGLVSIPAERKLNSSGHILSSENQTMCVTPTKGRRALTPTAPKTGKIAVATGAGIGHRHESARDVVEVTASTSKTSTVAQQNTTTSELAAESIKRQAKILPRPLPVPETRPTTIDGWIVRDVIDGVAVLEGPDGIWKAARGDTVPGLGRVDSIVLWGSYWIVATSRGLITTQ